MARQVAAALALSIENALTHETLQREKEGLQTLLEISRTPNPNVDFKKWLVEIANCLRRIVRQEHEHLAFYDETAGVVRIHDLNVPSDGASMLPETTIAVAEYPAGNAFREDEIYCAPPIWNGWARTTRAECSLRAFVRCGCFPLLSRERVLGAIGVGSQKENALSASEAELLKQVARLLPSRTPARTRRLQN